MRRKHEGERRVGLSVVLELASRLLYVAVVALAAAAIYVSLTSVAEAQAERDWDDVTDSAFDTAETDSANRDISTAQAKRDAAIDAERDAGCTLCIEAREAEEQREAANEATYAGTEALVSARAQAIVDAPADSQEQIDAKFEALDTLESYAEEWSPEGENEGTANPSDVEDARSQVEAQASEVESSSGNGSSGEEEAVQEDTAAEETTIAAPPPSDSSGGSASDGSGGHSGGNSGGDNGGSEGGSDEGGSGGDTGGPLAGIANAAGGFNLVSLLAAALIAIGVAYYIGGLIKEGVKARVQRIGKPEQAHAPQPSRKKSEAKSRPERQSRENRQPRNSDERRGSEAPTERPEKGTTKSAAPEDPQGDSFNLADRLEQMRREDSEGQNPPEQNVDKDSTAAELDDLFFNKGDDEDDEDGR